MKIFITFIENHFISNNHMCIGDYAISDILLNKIELYKPDIWLLPFLKSYNS